MATLHIIEGPVGAGKTTYALRLGRKLETPPLVLDAWMVTLFQPDRPEIGLWDWYAERKARCTRQILTCAKGLQDHCRDAVVELGLLRSEARVALYEELEAEARSYAVHVLDAPRETRRARVARRNVERGETYAMDVTDQVFEIASDLWEPVTAEERRGRETWFLDLSSPDG